MVFQHALKPAATTAKHISVGEEHQPKAVNSLIYAHSPLGWRGPPGAIFSIAVIMIISRQVQKNSY
jgi:hypothetical protein